eukprot:GEMP01007386.1.p1 GENE.GEMP01007386.1~~GEMP01007386.1.p1  ORF type:complete len:727 (+),score=212.18 GEMP01007386.1:78-2258(+)
MLSDDSPAPIAAPDAPTSSDKDVAATKAETGNDDNDANTSKPSISEIPAAVNKNEVGESTTAQEATAAAAEQGVTTENEDKGKGKGKKSVPHTHRRDKGKGKKVYRVKEVQIRGKAPAQHWTPKERLAQDIENMHTKTKRDDEKVEHKSPGEDKHWFFEKTDSPEKEANNAEKEAKKSRWWSTTDWEWTEYDNNKWKPKWDSSWTNNPDHRTNSKDGRQVGSDDNNAAPIVHCWIDIPWWSRGMLIGKNGEKLREIREKSNVQRGYLPPDTYGIYLKGTADQVCVAEAEMYQLLKNLKAEIDSREAQGYFEFETLSCPKKWPVEKLFDWAGTECEVTTIRRWKSELPDGMGEPVWDHGELPMEETIICIRAPRDQMPAVLLALNPKTEMSLIVHKVLHEYLINEKKNFFKSLHTQPGVAYFNHEGTHDDISKILSGRGVDRVMHEIANAIYNFIREARSNSGQFRVVEFNTDMMQVMGCGNIEEVVRKMESTTGASAHWVEKRWCYGEKWIRDTSCALLVITGTHHAVVVMEQRLKKVLNTGINNTEHQQHAASAHHIDWNTNTPTNNPVVTAAYPSIHQQNPLPQRDNPAPVVLHIDGRTTSSLPYVDEQYAAVAAAQAHQHHLAAAHYQHQMSCAGLNRHAPSFTPHEIAPEYAHGERSSLRCAVPLPSAWDTCGPLSVAPLTTPSSYSHLDRGDRRPRGESFTWERNRPPRDREIEMFDIKYQ